MFYCPECNPDFEVAREPPYETPGEVEIPPSFMPKYDSIQEEKKGTTTHTKSQTYESDENKEKEKEQGEEEKEEKEIEPTLSGVVDLIVTKQEVTEKDEGCFVCPDCQAQFDRKIKCNRHIYVINRKQDLQKKEITQYHDKTTE